MKQRRSQPSEGLLTVRTSQEEAELIARLAECHGLSKSDLVRLLLNREADRLAKPGAFKLYNALRLKLEPKGKP